MWHIYITAFHLNLAPNRLHQLIALNILRDIFHQSVLEKQQSQGGSHQQETCLNVIVATTECSSWSLGTAGTDVCLWCSSTHQTDAMAIETRARTRAEIKTPIFSASELSDTGRWSGLPSLKSGIGLLYKTRDRCKLLWHDLSLLWLFLAVPQPVCHWERWLRHALWGSENMVLIPLETTSSPIAAATVTGTSAGLQPPQVPRSVMLEEKNLSAIEKPLLKSPASHCLSEDKAFVSSGKT